MFICNSVIVHHLCSVWTLERSGSESPVGVQFSKQLRFLLEEEEGLVDLRLSRFCSLLSLNPPLAVMRDSFVQQHGSNIFNSYKY